MNAHDFLDMIHQHDCPCCGDHTNEDSELCEECLKELAEISNNNNKGE